MIYAVVSNKGGVGKSTIAYHVLTALLPDFRLVEIDDNNNTSSVLGSSKTLDGKVVSVKLEDGEQAFSMALFAGLTEGTDIIVDAGGGNDTKAVIEMLKASAEADNLTFIIPLMSNAAQIQNAIDTYQMVKGYNVVFALNNAKSKEEFIFWYGDQELDVEAVDKSILKIPTVLVPHTNFFDLAGRQNLVLNDVKSLLGEDVQDLKTANKFAIDQANKDPEIFAKIMKKFGMCQFAKKYIAEDLKEIKTVLKI
jgi:CobQ/CobB/MinD/ParA nucleotide binding domain